MSFDSALEEEVPRKAYFKVSKSINATVLKKELIEYTADKTEIKVSTQPAMVKFLISGDCLLDGRESYFSLKLKTNTFTAFLSGDITSIIKKVVIKLPSNSNQILEEIDSYNTLSSMIEMLRLNEDQLDSHWQSGLNCLKDHNRVEAQARARRFLNLNEGGWRTFTFQLKLCSILFHEQYLPLSLLNGILVEIHLAPASEAFHYHAPLEQWTAVFDAVEGMYLTQGQYNGAEGEDKGPIKNQFKALYNRPECTQQALEYEIGQFTYHASAVWMNAEYVKRLVGKATKGGGINIFYNSFRFNQIPNEGSLFLHINLTEQYQNLKRIFMVTLNKNWLSTSNQHSFNLSFNLFENFVKSYKFRIGSRSWQIVTNNDSAISYTQSLQSVGMYNKNKSNAISFSTFPRSQNIHVFDFEKVRDETHSGEDTTNGRNIRMEIQFNSIASTKLLKNDGDAVQVDGKDIILKKEVNPNDSVIYLYQLFTRMINISGDGIAVTE